MARTIEMTTTVLPGSRIEIADPELPEGQRATVRITLDEPGTRSFQENLAGYAGGQLFRSAAEVDAHLREERDSWE